MKWTMFSIDTSSIGDNENVILFNTLNKAILGFERTIYEQLRKCDVSELKKLCTNLNQPEIYDQLIEQDFLVDDSKDEETEFMCTIKDQWSTDNRINVHILPTLGCNFACPYCYQDGISRNANLHKEDVDEIILRLTEYLDKNPQITSLFVTLHGGEPTCNWDVVPYAMESLNTIANKYSLKISTTIVSNGYLLDKEKAELLHKYNWVRFQVTLDGLGDVNNRRRKLRGGGDTFTPIVKNIKYILDHELLKTVDIRINFDQENWNNIPELLDFLADNFPKERIILSFGLVTQTIQGTSASEHISEVEISSNDFINKYMYLYTYALSKGFTMGDSYSFGSICVGKMRNAFTFSPDKYIYKCLSCVGRTDESYKLWTERDALEKVPPLIDFDLYKECFAKKCPFIPICNCDCRFEALIHLGNEKKVYCRKDLLLNLNANILQAKYLG